MDFLQLDVLLVAKPHLFPYNIFPHDQTCIRRFGTKDTTWVIEITNTHTYTQTSTYGQWASFCFYWPSHSFGQSRTLARNTYPWCHTMRLNPELCDLKANILSHSHICTCLTARNNNQIPSFLQLQLCLKMKMWNRMV